jgi:hypothetical protein
MKVPEYVKDTMREDLTTAERLGVIQGIQDLAAQRKTAKETGNALKLPGDPLDVSRMVRSVRAAYGIPSMDDATEFDAWLKKYRPQ